VEWLQLLDNIPDTPEDLGKYLDGCSEEKRKRIAELSVRFNNVLSRNELKAIVAHELGHAKHHHFLKRSGMFLIASKSFALMQSLLKYAALSGPSSFYKPLRLFGGIAPFAVLPLAYIVSKAVSRNNEMEADSECSGEYQKGLLEFQKKNLVNELLRVPTVSHADKIKQMLKEKEWRSTHPNHAKRLAHGMGIDNTKLQKTSLSVTAKALTVLGLLALTEVCVRESLKIFS
jgi:Zn-dependent protease with chaperone function